MGLIDYGPHKLCTKHKHKIPELIKCVYCELEDVSTLDLADTLKIKQLEKERDELKDNWEGLKTELKNAAKLDVLFGEEDEVAKVSVVATLNIMSKLEGGKG